MIDGRRVIGVIPARAGSQRLPGKNVRAMAGRPVGFSTSERRMGASRVLVLWTRKYSVQ